MEDAIKKPLNTESGCSDPDLLPSNDDESSWSGNPSEDPWICKNDNCECNWTPYCSKDGASDNSHSSDGSTGSQSQGIDDRTPAEIEEDQKFLQQMQELVEAQQAERETFRRREFARLQTLPEKEWKIVARKHWTREQLEWGQPCPSLDDAFWEKVWQRDYKDGQRNMVYYASSRLEDPLWF